MIESVKIIERMLQDNAFDKGVLMNILDSMSFTPIIPVMLPAGNKILRSSTNDEHEFHKSVARLNYPPDQFARTDRTSLERKPMFYGSVFTSAVESENAYPRIISAFETTDILRDYNRKGKVITTQSVWMTQEDLVTFAFPYPKDMPRACKEIKSIREMWDAKKSAYKQEDVEFMEYMGEIMTRQAYSCLYEVTANVVDYILKNICYMDKPLDGVYYPSVWGDGAGVNICLKPDAVDRCVRFMDAKLVVIEKNVGNSFLPIVADSRLDENGVLQWTPNQYTLSMFKQAYGFKDIVAIDDGIVGIK